MVAVLVPILVSLGFFALIFGIIYMTKKENLAMIEKGMNPKLVENRPMPYRNLKWGLLLLGAGMGLFIAFVLDNTIFFRIGHDMESGDHYDANGANVIIYFALTAIGGGLGLMRSYKVEKKELLDKRNSE